MRDERRVGRGPQHMHIELERDVTLKSQIKMLLRGCDTNDTT